MDFYWKAPLWQEDNQCPNTTKFAKPIKPITVNKVRAIQLTNAKYRGSTFSGTFLLGDQVLVLDGKKRATRVEVLCRWFGHRLETRGLAFTVNLKKAVIKENFSGQVFTDFSK
jgi:hypothetical protein